MSAPADSTVVLGRSVAEFSALLAYGLPRRPGRWRVLLSVLDHAAFDLPWQRLARNGEIELTLVPDRGDGLLDIDRLVASLDEHTWIVGSTHVSHLYGTTQPVDALCALARQAGALSVIDGAQAAGRLDIDLGQMAPDVYMLVGRKALLAPLGTGAMILNTGIAREIDPVILSTRSVRPGGEPAGTEVPESLEGNLPDLASLYALLGSVEALLLMEPDAVQRHARRLLELCTEAAPSAGLVPVRPIELGNAGLATFRRADSTPLPEDLQEALAARGFVVATDSQTVRVSTHLSNTEADVLALMTAMEALCDTHT